MQHATQVVGCTNEWFKLTTATAFTIFRHRSKFEDIIGLKKCVSPNLIASLKTGAECLCSKFDSHENCLLNKTLCDVVMRHHVFRPAHESKHCCCLYANAQIHIHMHARRGFSFLSGMLLSLVKTMCVRGAYAINMNAGVWIVYYLYGVLLLPANKTRAGCFL